LTRRWKFCGSRVMFRQSWTYIEEASPRRSLKYANCKWMYDFSAIMKVKRKDLRHEVELADLHGLLQNTVACCLTGTPQLQRWLKQE